MKVNIIYWSGTGNTEMMAEAIGAGAKDKGAEVELKEVSGASAEDTSADVLVLGCPSMGDEVLEESDFEPFMENITASLSGKKVALFGSYDWGDGQWMRDWEERIKGAGATLVAGEGLIVNNTPGTDEITACKELGALLTEA